MASDSFVPIDFNTDSEDIFEDAVAYLQTRWPTWEPSDANLETWMLNAMARLASEMGELSTAVTMAIFRFFGENIAEVPAVEAVSATGLSDWTLRDATGYTIPSGTQIALRAVDGTLYAFETDDDIIVAPGSATVSNVPIRAVIEGEDANGLSGTAELVTALAYVEGVTVPAPTATGSDAEDTSTYIDRLVEELETMTPRPIVPRDFEILARKYARENGIDLGRVIAIDGWNPTAGTLGNERYVGMAMTDTLGEDLSGANKTAITGYLDALREINFVVEAGSPTYTTIKVTAHVITYPDFDPVQVAADVNAALTNYLSPAFWGQPRVGQDETAWLNATVVRYKEVAAAIDRVVGVDYTDTLSIATEAGVLGTGDVSLSGIVPLTRPGTLTITADNP